MDLCYNVLCVELDVRCGLQSGGAVYEFRLIKICWKIYPVVQG